MALPYSNSKADPVLAQGRIEKILMKFGVSQINFGRDLKRHEIRISFIFREIPISIPIDYLELAKKFHDDKMKPFLVQQWKEPFTPKQEARIKVAISASYSTLEDYLKAMLTMHELGIMTPEEIFFPNISVQGERMMDHIRSKAPQLIQGHKLLSN